MNKQYSVGDKVVVIDQPNHHGIIIYDEYIGKTFTISNILLANKATCIVEFAEDKCGYGWSIDSFIPVLKYNIKLR